MSYVISFLIVGVLGFIIVKNVLAIIQKVKDKKAAKKEQAVEVKADVVIDDSKKENWL